MRVFVTGSIATDHLMTFSGRFTEQLIPEQLHTVSLSFLVDDLVVRRGGVAANIAYGLGLLGLRPVLAGAVGPDFADYRTWLQDHGVDTSGVLVSPRHHTARFVCTTDAAQNQIASFYAGAMSEARHIGLGELAERVGGPHLVLIGANDPEAMLRHVAECRARGYVYASDISQQLALLDRESVRRLVTGAAFLFTNEYEHELLTSRTGWSTEEVLDRAGTWVTTLGPAGVRLQRANESAVEVRPPGVVESVDPTGAGDAFRAGFLAAATRGLDLVRAAQLGCLLAGRSLVVPGPQDYDWDDASARETLSTAYGPEVADQILSRLATEPALSRV
ncbi:carbohydrate kinase family protein [Paractinoplanes ferrugineus]|uniref:Kinase n=1 Tax=Paractinoplanes ferrugineus TaxID=113564 RepID=A0A919J5G4_9ACTN|nr:carbohydrate kinase family protein [Actinoplanes ferrugineus]GIE13702.1 kinase [Actinoplanes ferrugineus]